jgi:hypothetical protein
VRLSTDGNLRDVGGLFNVGNGGNLGNVGNPNFS